MDIRNSEKLERRILVMLNRFIAAARKLTDNGIQSRAAIQNCKPAAGARGGHEFALEKRGRTGETSPRLRGTKKRSIGDRKNVRKEGEATMGTIGGAAVNDVPGKTGGTRK
jgi:hypothetical protein